MSLVLHSAVNGETPNKEFIWFKALEKVNLKGYALVDRTFDANGQITNEFRHIFIFPDLTIPKGDFVCLKSGTGTQQPYKPDNKNYTIHPLFWGSKSCVWNDKGGDAATLIKFEVIESIPVPAVK